MLVDDSLPVYDVSDSVATVVDADLAATWDALMQVDLIEVGRRRPLLAVLGGVRALPDVIVRLPLDARRRLARAVLCRVPSEGDHSTSKGCDSVRCPRGPAVAQSQDANGR
jgi:hypothetical protein